MATREQIDCLLAVLRRLSKRDFATFARLADDRYTEEVELPTGELCIIHAEALDETAVGGVRKLVIPVTASVGKESIWAHIFAYSDGRVEVDEEICSNPLSDGGAVSN